MTASTKTYDVFLSHNNLDKPQVRALADWLQRNDVYYFLDEQSLEPGDILTDALGKAMENSKSAIICIGPDGEGPWHKLELDTLLNRSIKLSRQKNEFRIIPVMFPNADTSKLRWFLETRIWCDLSKGVTDSPGELLRLKRAILGERSGEALATDPTFNPYQGLKAFDRDTAQFFFGRDKETALLATQLRDWRFTCILGASGTGKSSLARAGLSTDAVKQIVPDMENWPRLSVKPGHDLLRSIFDQLYAKLPEEQRGPVAAASVTRIMPDPVRATAESWAEGLDRELSTFYSSNDKPVLILIDQFEEIFTHRGFQTVTEEQRNQSVRRVLDALALLRECGQKRWYLLITLRSDFKHHCRISDKFWQLLTKKDQEFETNHLTLELDELDEEGWREAIKSPAARAGAYLEAGLVESMLKDVYRQRGSMPLLQLALQELWKLRDGACLTHSGYKAIGGVAHALQQKAERTLTLLRKENPEYAEIARNLFLRLTSPGEGVSDTRRRVDRSELLWEEIDAARIDHVIAQLSDAENRLIVADEQSIEVTHEVLIRDCATIRGWIEAARTEIPILRRLNHAARRWQENDRCDVFLNAADPPRELKQWITHKTLSLTVVEREYWQKSRSHRAEMHNESRKREKALQYAQEQRMEDAVKARNRFAWISLIAIALALTAISISVWAYFQREQALFQEKDAISQKNNFKKASEESARNAEKATRALAMNDVEVGSVDLERKNKCLAMFKYWQAYDLAEQLPVNDPIRRSARNLVGGNSLGIALNHPGFVNCIAFSPDGQTVLTGSEDKTARFWDAKTGKPIHEPLQHQGKVSAVAFSPDGQTVLTGSDDKTARLWDAKTGKSLHQPLQHQGKVYVVAFSPDGQTILTGSWDTARLWDAKTVKPLHEPLQNQHAVYAVAFSPDGKSVLTGADTARLWDTRTGKLLHELQQPTVFAVAFSPDGQTVLTGSYDKTARLWDAKTGKPIHEPLQHNNLVLTVAFSPDGQTVLTGSKDNTARLWNARTGKPLGEPLQHQGEVSAVAFSPDGQSVLTGSRDKTARLWDARTGKPLREPLQHQGEVSAVAFSPDGQTVLTGSGNKSTRLWDVKMGKPLHDSLLHLKQISAVAFSPDGQTVLTGSWDETARLWNARTGKPILEPLRHQSHVNSVAFSPDGQIILTGSSDKTARLWDARTGKPLREPLQHQSIVHAVTFSPDGQTVLTGSQGNTARLWDTRTGKPLYEPFQHQNPVYAVAFSPDGRTVLTGSGDKTARFWDAVTGKSLNEPLQHKKAVYAVAFSPDGQTVLTGSGDNTARLWDARTGKPLHEPLQHQYLVRAVAFSPDGQTALTGSGDATARLWDVRTGKPLSESLQHQGDVTAVAFSPDGQTVLTGSDNISRLWHVPPPAADEPERLRLSVEVRTGYYLDAVGIRRELTQEQWLKRREELDSKGGFCDIRTWDQVKEEEKKALRTPSK